MKVIKLNNKYYILTTVTSFDYPLGKEAVVTYEYSKVINITYDTSNFDISKAKEITYLPNINMLADCFGNQRIIDKLMSDTMFVYCLKDEDNKLYLLTK